VPELDMDRTTQHGLGFVPLVWVRNLPGGSGIDGRCTFRAGIETVVDLDYMLSAGQRALMYQAAPRVVIKAPAGSAAVKLGPGDALIVDSEGDAKLLEISGSASGAIVEYAKELRERALEAMHGNRSNADKLSAAQSGKALEMLHQPLVWLADQLRISYGEQGLLSLMRMVQQVGLKMKLKIGGEPVVMAVGELSLRWRPWFSQTESDRKMQAETLKIMSSAGHMSREMAVTVAAPTYDNEDPAAELARIAAEQAAEDARLLALGAAAQVRDTESEVA